MSKRKKVDERSVEIEQGGSYAQACAEVKKLSGFDACLPLSAVKRGNKVEYVFLVGNDEGSLKTELFARQLEAERNL